MPLKDVLYQLQEQQKHDKEAVADRAALITTWKQEIDSLIGRIHQYVAEYEEDGSLEVKLLRMRITEDTLGTYEIGAMDIQAGPILVLVRPVGLMVAGAEGRVDMHRQGRPSEEDRIMLLRMRLSGPAYPPTWCMQFPPDVAARLDPSRPAIPGTRRVTPLDKGSLEIAIEFLLKLM